MTNLLNLEKTFSLLLALFFLTFFVNLVIDDGVNWSLNYVLLTLFIIFITLQKKIYISLPIFLTLALPFISIYIINLFFHNDQISNDHFFDQKLAPDMNNQFLYALAFLMLPTILLNIKKSENIFLYIINIGGVFSIIFNGYFNIIYNFDRALLVKKFDAIILYDASIASLSILMLVFNLGKNQKFSNILIVLSLINLFLIVAHGSRGTWLGIPLILIILSFYYFKSQRSKVLLTLLTSFILTGVLFFLPNSPIQKRLNAFQQDTSLIEKNNYHSSTGTRIFLWSYAVDEMLKSPIYGVGAKKFRDNICEQQAKGLLPACNPHAHNIFFQFLASNGLVGLLGIISAFLIPLIFYFYKLFQPSTSKSQHLSLMGICFTIFFSICGLTDFLFFMHFPTMFYFLITITLMSLLEMYHLESSKNHIK